MTEGHADERRSRFEAVAVPLMEPLYNAALRLNADPAAAADDVQDTFLRAFRTFDSFRPGTNARAWMFTILYSVFINKVKKSRREVLVSSAEELEEKYRAFVDAPQLDASSLGVRGEGPLAREVEGALMALPEAYRAAVLFVDVHDLSYEEAATALTCPIGTVQSRVHRGRRMLFAALKDYARQAGYSPRSPK
jgi:RNA polymerase sigma-70 factor (ECF subfamily)